ncbi:hypothetical protein BSIN_5159 [Burkholderia singularis]|uniref:Uncharacterized protein n=1 Tax=Burkholderia singularis TaxID=1503053 RepID=A0A238HBG7_9BURK|nr:hypothetical protein BSIN_5159 [Burkholderia singularis]
MTRLRQRAGSAAGSADRPDRFPVAGLHPNPSPGARPALSHAGLGG